MTRSNGLPSVWHEVRDELTGDLLYWRRQHSGYEVHPYGRRFEVWLDGMAISGEVFETLTLAIIAARDHMHANQVTR